MKFLRLIVIVLASFWFATAAQAQDGEKVAEASFFYQTPVVEGEAPTHRGYIETYSYFPNMKTGIWAFAYAEKDYFSAVAGPYHDIFSFGEESVFELGVAAGFEKIRDDESGITSNFPRYAGLMFIGSDNLFSEVYFENGPSGDPWLRVKALWQVKPRLALELLHQSGDGTGPRATISIPKTPVHLSPGILFRKNEDTRQWETVGLITGELRFTRRR